MRDHTGTGQCLTNEKSKHCEGGMNSSQNLHKIGTFGTRPSAKEELPPRLGALLVRREVCYCSPEPRGGPLCRAPSQGKRECQ